MNQAILQGIGDRRIFVGFKTSKNPTKRGHVWNPEKNAYDEADGAGGVDKLPINPNSGKPAKSNDASTWGSLQEAEDGKEIWGYDRIGIATGDGVCFIDLDACVGPRRQVTPQAQGIVSRMDTYCELSVSRTGLHLLFFGETPKEGKRKGAVEMYGGSQFMVLTGWVFGDEKPVQERTAEAAAIHAEFIATAPARPPDGPRLHTAIVQAPMALTDDEIVARTRASEQSEKIKALFYGDITGYQGHSEADMAFMCYMAFFSDRDPATMDRIMRRSSLFRPKWDERRGPMTYGERTIGKAINGCGVSFSEVRQGRAVIALSGASASPSSLAPDGTTVYSFDDTGNAYRLRDAFGVHMRYSFLEKTWYVFLANRWEQDNTGEVKRRADEVIAQMIASPMPEGGGFLRAIDAARHFKHTKNSAGKEAMIKETQHLEGIPVLPEDFDQDKFLLNLENGTLDLRTMVLHPHDPADMITKLAPVTYLPEAVCPLWRATLETTFDGNQDLIGFVQRALGYSITGSTKEQVFFIAYGTGMNGKSLLLEVVSAVLGDYALAANAETFMEKDRTGGASPEVVRLRGARFVTTVEPQQDTRLNEGLVKQLTGNETITARPLYAKEIQFKPEFKLWMATNHKPVVRGDDEGIWRRIMLIPFENRIPVEKRDKDLGEKLSAEGPGILNWMLEGYRTYLKIGLAPPKEVSDANAEYRGEMDIIATFLTDCVEENFTGSIRSTEMYEAFKDWSMANGFKHVMNQIRFSRELNKKLKSEHTSTGNRYAGYCLTGLALGQKAHRWV